MRVDKVNVCTIALFGLVFIWACCMVNEYFITERLRYAYNVWLLGAGMGWYILVQKYIDICIHEVLDYEEEQFEMKWHMIIRNILWYVGLGVITGVMYLWEDTKPE